MKQLQGPRTYAGEKFPCLVGGIPENCENPSLYIVPLFKKYGVDYVSIPDPNLNKEQDICFVHFDDAKTRDEAVTELNATMYRDNEIVVRKAPMADFELLPREIYESQGFGDYYDKYLAPYWEEDSDDETHKKMKAENEGKDKPDDVEDHEKSKGTGTGVHSAAAQVGTPAAVEVHVQEAAENICCQLSTAGKEPCLDILFSPYEAKNVYKDAILPPNWKAFQTIIFSERCNGLHDSEKIAALDFDGCLVNTSVKRVGPDAWSLMYPSIPEKLQELYNSGYKLVIFTNDSNIESWKNERQAAVDSKIGRLENFMKHVKVPMQVFIACGLGKSKDQTDDPFRKPKPGMWKIMEAHFNSGIAIDMDQSFYVGDAAGRVNDHSDADIKFAEAIGLKFHVPEKFFGA